MSQDGNEKRGTGTRLVEAGRRKEWTGPVVNPPVWRASTHLYENMAELKAGRPNEDGHFYYGRRGAPTQWALADALTALEPGAEGTVLYPSGVAAIAHTLMALLRPGDELLVTDNAYEPTRNIALNWLKGMGITARPFNPLDLDSLPGLLTDKVKVVMIESPGSLTMEVCDVPAINAIAHEHDTVTVIDNTWATALGFPALERGCDVSVMALTKHVGGHSDLMMGSATAAKRLFTKLRRHSQMTGQVVSPDDAALALRGLRTMQVRLERETATALEIARWLSGRDEVAAVLCPMLPGSQGHEIWKRDFTGGCGLFSFVMKGGSVKARNEFIDALELFGIGYSWGGYESLAIPVDPAAIRSETPWPPEGLDAGDYFGIRLAIGLEDPADLIADLEGGLTSWKRR